MRYQKRYLNRESRCGKAYQPAVPRPESKAQRACKPHRERVAKYYYCLFSSNYSICSRQQCLRDRDPNLLCCLEIDDQFELGGLLDRQIRRLRALENLSTYVAARRSNSGTLVP